MAHGYKEAVIVARSGQNKGILGGYVNRFIEASEEQ
jgi:hypothetical protein